MKLSMCQAVVNLKGIILINGWEDRGIDSSDIDIVYLECEK